MTAGMASAMPLAPTATTAAAVPAKSSPVQSGSVQSGLVQKVAWGCPWGWHPDYWGRCVPNVIVPGPVYHYYGWGWHRPVYYYHPGWRWHHPHPMWHPPVWRHHWHH